MTVVISGTKSSKAELQLVVSFALGTVGAFLAYWISTKRSVVNNKNDRSIRILNVEQWEYYTKEMLM
jgi:hypothetical protein